MNSQPSSAYGIRQRHNRASARCYSRQIMFRKDGGVGKIVGLYHDQLVRSGGTWLFQTREFEFIGQEPIAMPPD